MPNKPMKITFFHPYLGKNDEDSTIRNFALALKKFSVDVDFITTNRNKNHTFPEWNDDATFEIKELGNWLGWLLMPIRTLFGRRITPFLTYTRLSIVALIYVIFYKPKKNPTVVFVDHSSVILPIFKYFNVKVVYYCHNPALKTPHGNCIDRLLMRLHNGLEKRTTASADAVLVNSEYSKNIFKDMFNYPGGRTYILYPILGEDFMQYCVPENKKTLCSLVPGMVYGSKDFVFLCLGAFSYTNHFEIVIKALRYLDKLISRDFWRTIHVVLCGPADNNPNNTMYYLRLQNLVSRLNFDDQVYFIKNPSEQLRADLILATDFVIHTPTTDYFDKYILESMYAGKPVIASNRGGAQELITNYITGVKGELEPEYMAELMMNVMDRELSDKIASEAKKFISVSLSDEAFFNKIMNIICEDLGCDPGSLDMESRSPLLNRKGKARLRV